MQRTKISFNNQHGEPLAALLEAPNAQPSAYALFAHCFTCSKDIAAASRISRALAKKGIATLRFDFTGLGNSDGDFSNTNFSSNLEDLLSAAAFMDDEGMAPSVLVGHSLGGAAVLAVAKKIQSVKAVVTIAAPATGEHIGHMFCAHEAEIKSNEEAAVNLVGREFTIKKQFLEDIERYNDTDHIATLGTALLIFHSPYDSQVSIDEAAKIYTAAKHPKSFISLDHADHLLSKNEDAEYVANMMADWLGRYIDLSTQDSPAQVKLEKGEILIDEVDHKFTCNVYTPDHLMVADEPIASGGQHLGPNPYEFLLASLGVCTTMTVRMVAQRENIPLKDVSVKVSSQSQEVEDAESGKKVKSLNMHREITLEGELTQQQNDRLISVADRCPVHRTLHNPITISTTQSPKLD